MPPPGLSLPARFPVPSSPPASSPSSPSSPPPSCSLPSPSSPLRRMPARILTFAVSPPWMHRTTPSLSHNDMRDPPRDDYSPSFPADLISRANIVPDPAVRVRLPPAQHSQQRSHNLYVPGPSAVPPLHLHANTTASMTGPVWHPHVRVQPILPPPPPILHKVWILDCKSCGTFLTNRGMKAVLLLRPTVPLYSTDALPINCSAYSRPDSSSRSSSATSSPVPLPERSLPRSCECLTQTLCCHGCGTAVGYMIVIPCTRCTSSTSATNRATNGHRFVFYSSEISAEERHYVPRERGVLPDAYPQSLSQPMAVPPQRYPVVPASAILSAHVRESPDGPDIGPLHNLDADAATQSSHRRSRSSRQPSMEFPPAPPPSNSVTPPTGSRQSSHSPEQAVALPQRLKEGDVLYWHHLVRSGEIPAVCEDPRARGCADEFADDDAMAHTRCADEDEDGGGIVLKGRIIAGR